MRIGYQRLLPPRAIPGIKDKLLTGVGLNGRSYKNYIDGYNQLDYLSGKVKELPRKEFMYVNDDGQIVALRYDGWKAVFLENRGQAFGVWREPFTELARAIAVQPTA